MPAPDPLEPLDPPTDPFAGQLAHLTPFLDRPPAHLIDHAPGCIAVYQPCQESPLGTLVDATLIFIIPGSRAVATGQAPVAFSLHDDQRRQLIAALKD